MMGQKAVLKTIGKFRKALESANIKIDKMILFGSHAAGTARNDSGIDVVVISRSFEDKSHWQRIDILSEAVYKVFAPIEPSAF